MEGVLSGGGFVRAPMGQLTAGAERILNLLVLQYVRLDIQVLFIVSTIPGLTDYFDLVCVIIKCLFDYTNAWLGA